MKITSLIENTEGYPFCKAEHGLSLYIETNEYHILFDSGQTNLFAENAKTLGIDLRLIDFMILSHGHYDHGGGIPTFTKINPNAPIYMNQNAFEIHKHGKSKDIGLNPAIKQETNIIFTGDTYSINDGIRLYICNTNKPKYPIQSYGLQVIRNGKTLSEDFIHEHYLEIKENGKKILFSGCSHKGILNIMDWFHPDILIGGFHLKEVKMDEEGKASLDSLAIELNQYPAEYYTCHCTGIDQYEYLKTRMNHLHYLHTGQSIII